MSDRFGAIGEAVAAQVTSSLRSSYARIAGEPRVDEADGPVRVGPDLFRVPRDASFGDVMDALSRAGLSGNAIHINPVEGGFVVSFVSRADR